MEILARAVGRRKEAVAQIQLVRGNGQFFINDKPAQAYLQNNSCSLICIKSPLQAALSLYSNQMPLTTQSTESLVPLQKGDTSFRREDTPLFEKDPGFPEDSAIPNSSFKTTALKMKQEKQSLINMVQTEQSEIAPFEESEAPLKSGVPLQKPPFVEGEAPPSLYLQKDEKANFTNDSVPHSGRISASLDGERSPQNLFSVTDKAGTKVAPSSEEQFKGINETKLLSLQGQLRCSLNDIDVIIKVKGGGLIGQAEAIKLGIARAFCIYPNGVASPEGMLLRSALKTKGYLRQDSRVKERRKYGLKKARKASQYHKR